MSGWENVTAHDGVTIALFGMLIVFSALAIISGFIAALPKGLNLFNERFPEKQQSTASAPTPAPKPRSDDNEKLAAAIAYAAYLQSKNPT